MTDVTRREVLLSFTAIPGALSPGFAPAEGVEREAVRSRGPTPTGAQRRRPAFVLFTDLFRPQDDFDDHLDLAMSFALTHLGLAELKGVLIDNPRNVEPLPFVRAQWRAGIDSGETLGRDPDIAAVAQLNHITSLAVPAAVGPVWSGKVGDSVTSANVPKVLRGVRMLLEVLEHSAQPISIVIVGSALNVAMAGTIAPDLFEKKCAGIYLNAGFAQPHVPGGGSREPQFEWNVRLNPGAFAALFALPCPIYWLPCFDDPTLVTAGKHGSVWPLRYGEVFPKMSDDMKNYVSFVLRRKPAGSWLSYLLDTEASAAIREFTNRTSDIYFMERGKAMYSTASLFQASGTIVGEDGAYRVGTSQSPGVYEFLPIEIECSSQGLTRWKFSEQKTGRYIIAIEDRTKYERALAAAFGAVLAQL